MMYYLLLPSDGEYDSFNEANLLGESSLNNFWPGLGLKILLKIVDTQPEILPLVKIKTDLTKDELSVGQFLEAIAGLSIKKQ